MWLRAALLVAILFALPWSQSSFSDKWAFPKPATTLSPNGKYSLTIIPDRKFPNLEVPALGLLKHIDERGSENSVWLAELVNLASPVSAMVSDDGRWVLTFDEYHAVGWGDNVIVAYDSAGRFTQRYGLKYFLSEEQIRVLPRSVGSMWWHCGQDRIVNNDVYIGVRPGKDEEGCNYFRLNLLNGEMSQQTSNDYVGKQRSSAGRKTSSPMSMTVLGQDDEREEQDKRRQLAIANSPPLVRVIRETQEIGLKRREVESTIIEKMKPFIAAAVNIDAPDEQGKTALDWCGWLPEVALYLIQNGADPNTNLMKWDSPLSNAISRRNTELVDAMLQAGAKPNQLDNTGHTPLIEAIDYYQSTSIVRLLIDAGADVNKKSKWTYPLDAALTGHGWDIVDILLESGALLENLSTEGALFLAVYQNDINSLDKILSSNPKFREGDNVPARAIAAAARLDRVEVVSKLIRTGVSPEATSGLYKSTPLIEAVHSGALAAARVLLREGVDPNTLDVYGYSPLDVAYLFKKPEMIRLLSDAGADESIGISQLKDYQQNAEDLKGRDG